MKEVKIDVSQQKPRLLTDRLMDKADKIVVMEPELATSIPKKYLLKLEEWKIEKLLGKSIGQVRKIRNQIKKRVEKLIKDEKQIK